MLAFYFFFWQSAAKAVAGQGLVAGSLYRGAGGVFLPPEVPVRGEGQVLVIQGSGGVE